MIERFDDLSRLPGQQPVGPRRERWGRPAAAAAGALWPPLILTLLIWPPQNWLPGRETDWRLLVLAIGIAAAPVGLWAVERERERTGQPRSRLGIVWRFMLYGGLTAAALQALFALAVTVLGWFEAGDVPQALGATETTLLIFGIGGLPLAIIVGVSYALWAGLCAAFLAYEPRPEVKDRLGVLGPDRRRF